MKHRLFALAGLTLLAGCQPSAADKAAHDRAYLAGQKTMAADAARAAAANANVIDDQRAKSNAGLSRVRDTG